MTGSAPLVSVVVPTRDRPRFLEWCLRALRAQTMDDYEVIVSDNPTTAPARAVVDELGDARFCYLAAEQPLAMADNWERGVSHARGTYVAVLTDKMTLGPRALQVIAETESAGAPDIVTWWNSAYRPLDEEHDLGPGYFDGPYPPAEPFEYSPREVLERRLSFAVRRDRTGTEYFRAKICFGAFHRRLVDRIRDRTGQVFFPITPDYTSTAAASVLATSALDLGRAHAVSFESVVSNGKRYATDLAYARRYLEESDPSGRVLDELPIPGVFASLHNLVAHDLITSAHRAGGDDLVRVSLDRPNLAARAAEDLALLRVRDPSSRREREAQVAALGRWASEHAIATRASRGSLRARTRVSARRALATNQAMERLVLRVAGHRSARYDDIVQAAAAQEPPAWA